MDKAVIKAKDIHFLPEYEIGLISKNETPYKYRLDSKKYPFKDIYTAASLSGKRDEKTVNRQLKLLNSKDKIVRYWAVIGLMSQNKQVLKKYKSNLIKVLGDSNPPVKITAAAILYEVFGDEKSIIILNKYSNSDDSNLALMTINYLLYIKNKNPFTATVKRVKEKSKHPYQVKAACKDFLTILEGS